MPYPSMSRAERETEEALQAASQARAEQAAQDYAVREAARRKAEQAVAAQREQAREKAAAELAAAQHARAAALLEQAKAEARARWLAAGGDAPGFEAEWPAMRAGQIRAQLRAEDHAQAQLVRDMWRG